MKPSKQRIFFKLRWYELKTEYHGHSDLTRLFIQEQLYYAKHQLVH